MTEPNEPPREIVVPGRPVPIHAPAALVTSWQAEVRRAAIAAWSCRPGGGAPVDGDVVVSLEVVDVGAVGDLDAKATSTVAALVGPVLADGDQVSGVEATVDDLQRAFRRSCPSPALATALEAAHDREQPFVRVVVRPAGSAPAALEGADGDHRGRATTTRPVDGAVDGAVDQVARRWSDDGWDVVVAPAPHALPAALRGHTVDAVASRGGRSCAIVVLVHGRTRAAPGGDLARLAAAVPTLPGWTLVVEWVGDLPVPPPADVLRERMRGVDALLAGPPVAAPLDAALLMAWSAAEGAMLTLAPPTPLDRPRKGLALANHLHDQGVLAADALDVLRRAQRYRGQIAHGRDPGGPVPPALVGELTALAERLLDAAELA